MESAMAGSDFDPVTFDYKIEKNPYKINRSLHMSVIPHMKRFV